MLVQSHLSPDRIICLCKARQAASHTHTRCSIVQDPGQTAVIQSGIQGVARAFFFFIYLFF